MSACSAVRSSGSGLKSKPHTQFSYRHAARVRHIRIDQWASAETGLALSYLIIKLRASTDCDSKIYERQNINIYRLILNFITTAQGLYSRPDPGL